MNCSSVYNEADVRMWAAEVARVDMLDENELTHLAKTLKAYPWESGDIVVEIGAYHGDTTVFMVRVLEAIGAPVGTGILSIDPFERFTRDALNPQGSFAAYMNTVKKAGFEDRCLPLVAFSSHAASMVSSNIGVLVVDGDHHYDTARLDLQLFCPKVLPGGYVFVDDLIPQYPGVIRAVDEYFTPGNPTFEIVTRQNFLIARKLI